jgi:hypothetical protein
MTTQEPGYLFSLYRRKCWIPMHVTSICTSVRSAMKCLSLAAGVVPSGNSDMSAIQSRRN